MSEEKSQQHIQIAEIVVDPAQLDSYKSAVTEQIEAAIRLEPGVLALYSVSNKDNPSQITVFEIYRSREAYLAHLQGASFPEVQGHRREDGQIAQVDPGGPGHARQPGEVERWFAIFSFGGVSFHHKVEGCGGLAAAGIEEVITRIGLAPIAKDALQAAFREIRLCHLFRNVGQAMSRQRGIQHLDRAVAGHLAVHTYLQFPAAFFKLPCV